MIRTLIVDDDLMVADANKAYVESVSGFHCIGMAHDAAQAVQYLENKSVDLMLLDIFMPGKSGIDLLKQLRQAVRGVDVIVISAASDMGNIKQALRLGAVDYLIKPFEFERFHAALRAYETEHHYMTRRLAISQTELDTVFLHQDKGELPELPKGLTHSTLKTLFDEVITHDLTMITAESLSKRVGVSRVTVGKYLRFMTDIGFFTSSLEYRSVGRPVYHYTVNPNRKNVAAQYAMRCAHSEKALK